MVNMTRALSLCHNTRQQNGQASAHTVQRLGKAADRLGQTTPHSEPRWMTDHLTTVRNERDERG